MKRILTFVFLFLTGFSLFGQQLDKNNTNAKVKAVFIYNFTKYFEWPNNSKSSNFIITVIGDLPLYNELKQMAIAKKAGNQGFEIRTATTVEEAEKSHILFIGSNYSNLLGDATIKLKDKNILIITEKQGLAKQGSAINFVVVNNKQKFELNKKNAEKHGLSVSSSLEKLAIPIE